jgi:hypothetical protein
MPVAAKPGESERFFRDGPGGELGIEAANVLRKERGRFISRWTYLDPEADRRRELGDEMDAVARLRL